MEEEHCIDIFYEITKGLTFLHTNDFCHNDLKPENILILQNDKIVISDFGFTDSRDTF